MMAVVMNHERHVLAEDTFVEIVIWHVPHPVRGSVHHYKYRLALVVEGRCVLRYDNEAGKGDHRHLGDVEMRYVFGGYDKLLSDFWSDVDALRRPT